MPVEERSLTSGEFPEETNRLEIGFAYQLHLRVGRSRKELYSPSKMVTLSASRPKWNGAIVCWRVKLVGKPDAGNPHVRFDEGECGNGVWNAAIEAPKGKP